MKKTFILFVFLCSSNFAIAQTISGFYVQKMLRGVGDNAKLSETAKAPDVFAYLYSKNKSSLKKLTKGGTVIDTLKRKNEEYNFDYETVETTITMSDILYVKNLKDNNFQNIYSIGNKPIYIKDNLPKFEWTIVDETKNINGFLCKKATTNLLTFGYKLPIVAWFCEKIPVADGPFQFYNLPGFIFELGSEGIFTTTFTEFKYDEKKSIDILDIETNLQSITIQELENKR